MIKSGLHPRNRHQGRYDFKELVKACPELRQYLVPNPRGDSSIDFTNAKAVLVLNRAILKQFYGVVEWDIPPNYLCPPIPGRADYIHHIADLMPEGGSKRVLDIGIGASCVYPLIGNREYGWNFVGTDTDPVALKSAKKILNSNKTFAAAVELRLQKNPDLIFEGMIQPGEKFDLSICNPPFHASMERAEYGTRRKWTNLGKTPNRRGAPVLNFGGIESEICCEGGELGFITRMIQESQRFADQCYWFSTLVSKEANLPPIGHALRVAKAKQVMIEMFQGQKKSRIMAWTFQRKT